MSPETAFVACRFVHFLALMLLFGQTAFVAFITRTNATSARDLRTLPDLRERLQASGRPILIISGIAMLLSAIAMVPIQAAQMGDGWIDSTAPADWIAVLGTAFGQVWQWHLGLVIATVIAAATLPQRQQAVIVAMLSGLALATLGLIGHAAMHDGAIGVLQRGNHALHLLSAALWFGALPPLLTCLRALRDASLRTDAAHTMRRFSRSGHWAVGIVLLTGMANTALVLRGWPLHLGSPYQRWLDAKIVLVLAMSAIALFNRYRLVPALQRTPQTALRALIVGTWSEILLGGGVLLLVSTFATFDPH